MIKCMNARKPPSFPYHSFPLSDLSRDKHRRTVQAESLAIFMSTPSLEPACLTIWAQFQSIRVDFELFAAEETPRIQWT